MSVTDLIKKVHKLIKRLNAELKDYDIDSYAIHRTLTEVNEVLDTLNAYSYKKCKTFYTYYSLIENRKGFALGASLLEKSSATDITDILARLML